jgi:hypothetical protein
MKKCLFITMIIAAAAMVFAGCKKDEEDPVQKRIKELTALEKVQANEVRAAVEPAKTQPRNITTGFNNNFHGVVKELNKGSLTNLADSAEVLVKVVDKIEADAKNDEVEMVNEETLKALRTKCKTYLVTVEELLAALTQGS